MEIGQQQIDGAEPVAWQDEQIGLAGEGLDGAVRRAAALSSRRRLVVPTATIRPPRGAPR